MIRWKGESQNTLEQNLAPLLTEKGLCTSMVDTHRWPPGGIVERKARP
jgi:hypothetical protein